VVIMATRGSQLKQLARRPPLLLLALALAGCAEPVPTIEPGGVVLAVPADAEPAVERLLASALQTLERLGAPGPRLERLVKGSGRAGVEALARDWRAGLVLVLEAEQLCPDLFPAASLEALGASGFRLVTTEAGDFANRLGDHGATILYAAGRTPFAHHYATYEILRRLGARFYHPEEEHLPRNDPAALRARARTPTAVARRGADGKALDDYLPDFEERSYTFHGAHPLEHLEAFSDAAHPLREAENLNAWVIKNRGNLLKGATRGVAPLERYEQRKAELDAFLATMRVPASAGITLHNQQQGANAVVDPASPIPPRQQIEDHVAKQLAAAPDAESFGIHFGPTEFTTTPDQETLDWINWAGQKALSLKPTLRVEVNNHITGSQPTGRSDLGCPTGTNAKQSCDYYDLAFHTDKRFAVKVHTVMFYPLSGAARVYNQKSFSHKLCLMKKASAEGRPLTWFPEGSWWLSFDNPVPVYLPLYLWSRGKDLELLRPLLRSRGGGTLDRHRMFNSGHEWGYWQQDYAVGLWHWNAEVTLEEVVGELVDPLCAPAAWRSGCAARSEAAKVLLELMAHQAEVFLEKSDHKGLPGGLYAYFAGEDPADEIAAATGLEFRPVKVPFSTVARWSQAQLAGFRGSDLAALASIEQAHVGWLARLKALEASVPEAGQSWLQEIVDGVEINLLRARQAHRLYGAVIARREAQLGGGADASAAIFAEAERTLADAEAVIRRREARYRYPAAQMFGGGLTAETAVPNGTTYPYRVHTKTHLLSYWKNRHEDVKAVLAGKLGGDALVLSPVFAPPGAPLSLTWPAKSGLTATLSVGSQAATEQTSSLELAGEGFFPLAGKLVLPGGGELALSGGVARASLLASSPKKALSLKQPDSSLAQSVLNPLFPALRWAVVGGAAPGIAFAPDLDDDGDADYAHAAFAASSAAHGATFSGSVAGAYRLPLPNPGGGGETLTVTLSSLTVSGTQSAGKIDSPVRLAGKLSVEDLVQALIDLAGFDRKGALAILATVLGFDAASPPAEVSFVGDFAVSP
jgi:hypothetical protein